MLSFQRVTIALTALTLLAGLGSGCQRQSGADEAMIDKPPIAESDPGAERPRIDFPTHCQQQDKALNSFIEHALTVCQKGDYDGFCTMLGTKEVPPSLEDFQRIWHGVGEIRVISVRSDDQVKPPEYYIHALVHLRERDRKGRQERDLIIRAYQEDQQWRLSGVTKEIAQKVLAADSQPAPGAVPAPGPESTRGGRD